MEFLSNSNYSHLDTVDNISVWSKEDIQVSHLDDVFVNIYSSSIFSYPPSLIKSGLYTHNQTFSPY